MFATPIPPTISASSETTHPVEMISRLDVSTFTAWPGSVTAVVPAKRRCNRAAVALIEYPGLTTTPTEVISFARPASRCTSAIGSTMPRSSNRSPEW